MSSIEYYISDWHIQTAIRKLCNATTNSGGITAMAINDVFGAFGIAPEQTQKAIRHCLEEGSIILGHGLKLIINQEN